jgi:hypothetical protein
MDGEDVDEVIELNKPFIGIVSNSDGLEELAAEVLLRYEGYNYDSPLSLSIVACSDWNWNTKGCDGSWTSLETSRNISSKIVRGNHAGFEAYFLTENTCGTGGCQPIYGETSSNCPQDCIEGGSSTTTIISGGGGGGGGSSGLSSADLKKIEEIVRSFIDVGGLKIETTSIYKEMFPGDESTIRVKVKNILSFPVVATLSSEGDASEFIFFDSSLVDLDAGQIRDVIIKLVAPKFVEVGDYDGEIFFEVGGESGSIPITIKVILPEGKLLDVKVQPLTPSVEPGKSLRYQADLLNLGKTKRVDVQFDVQVININTGEICCKRRGGFCCRNIYK